MLLVIERGRCKILGTVWGMWVLREIGARGWLVVAWNATRKRRVMLNKIRRRDCRVILKLYVIGRRWVASRVPVALLIVAALG